MWGRPLPRADNVRSACSFLSARTKCAATRWWRWRGQSRACRRRLQRGRRRRVRRRGQRSGDRQGACAHIGTWPYACAPVWSEGRAGAGKAVSRDRQLRPGDTLTQPSLWARAAVSVWGYARARVAGGHAHEMERLRGGEAHAGGQHARGHWLTRDMFESTLAGHLPQYRAQCSRRGAVRAQCLVCARASAPSSRRGPGRRRWRGPSSKRASINSPL